MFQDLLKKTGAGLLVGVGLALLAPVVLPVVARAARPLAKAVLHGYFDLVDELHSLAADVETKPTPIVDQLVATGFTEAATAAGETAMETGVGEALVEGVVEALVVV
jgi:hypothetical protein